MGSKFNKKLDQLNNDGTFYHSYDYEEEDKFDDDKTTQFKFDYSFPSAPNF